MRCAYCCHLICSNRVEEEAVVLGAGRAGAGGVQFFSPFLSFITPRSLAPKVLHGCR